MQFLPKIKATPHILIGQISETKISNSEMIFNNILLKSGLDDVQLLIKIKVPTPYFIQCHSKSIQVVKLGKNL